VSHFVSGPFICLPHNCECDYDFYYREKNIKCHPWTERSNHDCKHNQGVDQAETYVCPPVCFRI